MIMHKHKIQLSKNQKNKLCMGYKKRREVILHLGKDQLKNGNVEVFLTDRQHKAIKKGVGIRLALDHQQLEKNVEGGLLKEMLELAENNVPYIKRFISPLIKEKVAPLLKNQFIPWLKKLIDDALDALMEKNSTGSGINRQIKSKLNRVKL